MKVYHKYLFYDHCLLKKRHDLQKIDFCEDCFLFEISFEKSILIM